MTNPGSGSQDQPAPGLFLDDGFIDRSRLADDALEVLEACVEWLVSVERAVFLPIDLLGVLLSRGHQELERVVAGSSRDEESPLEQLRGLARRVDRESVYPARLHVDQFSLGFTGILTDALSWAREAGRDRLNEADLVRVMRWRAELQESASIRWALRQLAQPGGEFIFEPEGGLRRSAFAPETWLMLLEGMQLSARSGLAFLGTPHTIAAVAMARGMLAEACTRAGLGPRRLRDDLLSIVGERSPAQSEFQLGRQTLTPRLVRMLIAAARLAEGRGRRIRERELLEVFLTDGGSSLEMARSLGLESHLRSLLDGPESPPDRVSVLGGMGAVGSKPSSTLDQLGRDLSAEAREGRLPDVLGREEELQSVINVLMRSEQRNPLLTGKAGVGKTALANALARRIAEGTVPARLAGMRVVEINGASLVGGTSYRGELEARIKALLEECEDDVILFIDEAHAVFAPRSSSGQPAEIPNHFKSALASGRIAVVAATTEAEYRRWIEDDPALRRRFERIHIEELSPELTRAILTGLAPRFEQEYEVPVTPDAVDAAIELSMRFIPEQSLPDKAKKLLMDATIAVASELAVQGSGSEPVARQSMGTPSKRVVTRMDVARQVARKTGAPLDRVARGSLSWWVGLEERIGRHVVGQERAVREVARHLVSSRLNAVGRNRPQGMLVLVGPPGVGKVDVARALAEEVFGTKDALLSLEMSDFAEAHSLSRLIGSPPGYVGYQDEDALVTPLRRRPSSVVLLQSFGSAHPRVQERLVRLLSEGEIADTRGLKADATHAIFVLTVDTEVQKGAGIGFGRRDEAPAATDVLRQADPALEQRLRGQDITVVSFDGLAESRLGEQLIASRLEQFSRSLQDEYDIELVVPATVYGELLETVGRLSDARDVERVFRERVVEPITHLLLAGAVGPKLTLGEPAAGIDALVGAASDAPSRTAGGPLDSALGDQAIDPRVTDPKVPRGSTGRPSNSSSGEWEPEPA